MSVESPLHGLEAPGQLLSVPTDCNRSVAVPAGGRNRPEAAARNDATHTFTLYHGANLIKPIIHQHITTPNT
jgi:hypothetical protein